MIRFIKFTRKVQFLVPRKCKRCGDEFVAFTADYCRPCVDKARPWKVRA